MISEDGLSLTLHYIHVELIHLPRILIERLNTASRLVPYLGRLNSIVDMAGI